MCSEYLEELYIRAVYKVLVEVGHDLVLSAPLKNQSAKVTSVDVRQDDAYVLTKGPLGRRDEEPKAEAGKPFGTEDDSEGRLN